MVKIGTDNSSKSLTWVYLLVHTLTFKTTDLSEVSHLMVLLIVICNWREIWVSISLYFPTEKKALPSLQREETYPLKEWNPLEGQAQSKGLKRKEGC